jgi:DNA polymerase-3 subunit epsilon
MINEALEKLSCGKNKNEALDIEVMYKKLHDINDKNFSLDELSNLFKLPKPTEISATDDTCYYSILFFEIKKQT